MKAKQNLITLAVIWFVLLIPAKMFSQTDTSAASRREKIKAQEVAYITQKLNLTADESQKFWPVYNEYDAQKEALNKAFHQKMKTFRKPNMTDAQADSIIVGELAHEQALLDLKKSYVSKFLAVLPAPKVAKLGEAERGLRRMLLKLIKDQRKNGNPNK